MVELRQIVRIINSDIPGNRQIYQALTSIYGVGYSFAASVCNVLQLDKYRKVGSLSNEEVKKIEEVIKHPIDFKIPPYLFNRKKDIESGKDIHVITSDLRLARESDIKLFKKIKSYRGIRHGLGLPVRGQRTRSNFRKGKAVGVSKKKKPEAAQKEGKEGKK